MAKDSDTIYYPSPFHILAINSIKYLIYYIYSKLVYFN